MAHQMSPPQRPQQPQQLQQRPYSPYQQQTAHSPPGIALPPAKRQRLSPGIGSPQLSTSPFPGSPYGPYSAPAGSPPPFNVPQPHAYSTSPPPAGIMGPPPRPTAEQKAAKEKEEKEKVTDISDISDAMWGSGVDLREEENYLSSTNRTFYGSQSFSQSFGDSQSTIASPNNSFSNLTQSLPGSHLHGSGPVSQPAASMESIEAEIDRKHREAAMKYAKEHEQHLRHPFLLGNSTRHKVHKIAVEQGVHLDVKGLYEPPRPPQRPPQTAQGINGVVSVGENDTGLASIRAKSIPEAQHAFLEEGARYAEILSILSLAANERLRTLLDEAFTISRGRQLGSHGVVPPELADIATGQGRRSTSVKQESITRSLWDPAKAPPESVDGKQETVSFANSLPSHLSSLAISEHSAEAARVKRRAERAAKAAAAANASADGEVAPGTSPATPAPGTPAPATPISNESPIAAEKPLTKKEREKLAKGQNSETVLHKNANTTAAMQLGFGKKAKKYSWMTGGAGSGAPTNPFAKPVSKSSGGGENRKEVNGEVRKEKKGLGKERKFGDWREDGEKGKGVQLRDLAVVMDRDGKSRRALELAWLKLEKEGL
ncbi:Dynactin, isoform [Elsinoe australis]|uniref:Transcription initiation factor TFIID subunit 4 n=1 Tax=Elsinoe australis TaxID=40998 RepID=A0A2P7ZMI6_9PEZI|nr:Dynactin, isoform [Elsinoe australis]